MCSLRVFISYHCIERQYNKLSVIFIRIVSVVTALLSMHCWPLLNMHVIYDIIEDMINIKKYNFT